jgi:hypothetical protein
MGFLVQHLLKDCGPKPVERFARSWAAIRAASCCFFQGLDADKIAMVRLVKGVRISMDGRGAGPRCEVYNNQP